MNNGRTLLTNLLAGVIVVIWALVTLSVGEQGAALVAGFIPASVEGIISQPVPAVLTPLTSAFLHSGAMHLLFNLVMLVFCGRWVETALGARLMALLFVIGAYVAAFAQWAVEPSSMVPVIGASGAISALVGAYAIIFSQNKTQPIGPLSAYAVRILWLAVAWIALQFLIGLVYNGEGGGIAIWAHIGGFVAGLLLARPLLKIRYRAQ